MSEPSKKLNNIGNFFRKIRGWIKGNIEDQYDAAESKAEAAVLVVNEIKRVVEDPTVELWTSLSKSKIDDQIIEVAKVKISQIAHGMGVARGILKESDSPKMAIYNVIDHLRKLPKPGRRSWWIEFAAELLGAFMDGKLSFPELVSLTQMVLKKLFPNK